MRIVLMSALLAVSPISCKEVVATSTGGQSLSVAQCGHFEVDGKNTICHATGSATQPYVVLRVALEACLAAHADHAGDKIAVDGDCGPDACLPAGAPCDATLRCCGDLACGDGVCKLPLAPEGTGLRAIQDRGHVVIGTKRDVRIFGWLIPGTDEVEGFDVDMGKAITLQIFGDDASVVFKEAISANRIPYLNDGTVDVIASTMTITAARALLVDFSKPYFVATQRLLVPTTSTIDGLASLAGKKVGTVGGTTSETNIRAKTAGLSPPTEIVLYASYNHAVAGMESTTGPGGAVPPPCDAVTTDDVILYGLVRDKPTLRKVVGDPFSAEPYGIAVKKGNTELRDAIDSLLQEMKDDGRWAEIYLRWLGPPAPVWDSGT